MKYEVILRLIEDDATGDMGLVHSNAFNKGFNSFWSPDGIFHDVFEHYFEDKILPYFKGRNSFQLFGEMCASGHGIAYRDIGINNFKYRKSLNSRDFTADTIGELENLVYEEKENGEDPAYLQFPLEYYGVPRQQYHSAYNLNGWIADYLDWYKENKHFKCLKALKGSQITNCYTYGYKRAERIIGVDKKQAYTILDQFLENWQEITQNSCDSLFIADDDAYAIHSFKFKVANAGNKLKVETTIIDELRQEFPIEKLIYGQ